MQTLKVLCEIMEGLLKRSVAMGACCRQSQTENNQSRSGSKGHKYLVGVEGPFAKAGSPPCVQNYVGVPTWDPSPGVLVSPSSCSTSPVLRFTPF